jgi:hypothetical protein
VTLLWKNGGKRLWKRWEAHLVAPHSTPLDVDYEPVVGDGDPVGRR